MDIFEGLKKVMNSISLQKNNTGKKSYLHYLKTPSYAEVHHLLQPWS